MDYFTVTKNVFKGGGDPVSIFVGTTQYPGPFELNIYNSAGEHIKTLDSRFLEAPYEKSYYWDGTNKYGDTCASGVYLFYLTEPMDRKTKRVIFIR